MGYGQFCFGLSCEVWYAEGSLEAVIYSDQGLMVYVPSILWLCE